LFKEKDSETIQMIVLILFRVNVFNTDAIKLTYFDRSDTEPSRKMIEILSIKSAVYNKDLHPSLSDGRSLPYW
jgi:hypothetical protein